MVFKSPVFETLARGIATGLSSTHLLVVFLHRHLLYMLVNLHDAADEPAMTGKLSPKAFEILFRMW